MKALIAGWFSFADMGATAGDLLVRDLVCDWLREAGTAFDVAHAPPFAAGVRWDAVNPAPYSHLVFVCGPFGNGPPVNEMLERFSHCEMIGVDLTMLDPLAEWNPFSLLLERDSDRMCRPDLAMIAPVPVTPVVGVVLIHPQPEYRERDLHQLANGTIEAVVAERTCARLRIDTRLDVENHGGLRTPGEVLALVAKTDVVLTTRLHGLVLALRCGVPAVAVDPVAGGAKVSRQAEALGWPWCFPADVSVERLAEAFDECLTAEARRRARAVRSRARRVLAGVHDDFVRSMSVGAERPDVEGIGMARVVSVGSKANCLHVAMEA